MGEESRKTRRLRLLVERRTCAWLWGKKYFVVPRLVSNVFGDGLKLLAISPIMFRPHYFVVRIDSSWSTSNWEHDEDVKKPSDWLDEVLVAIKDEYPEWPWAKRYGLRWTEDDEDERSSRIDFSDGLEWWEMDFPGRLFARDRRRREAVLSGLMGPGEDH